MQTLPVIALVTSVSVSLSSPAFAHIVCDAQFQVVNGHEIATPYCATDNLAHVAREHGVRISTDELRGNSTLKHKLCKTFGDDIRVRGLCAKDQDR